MKTVTTIHRMFLIVGLLTGMMLCSAVASATSSAPHWAYTDDKAPIHAKAFYDINVTDAETMKNFLWVIDETYNLLIDKGVPAHRIKFVVSLRGMSVTYATQTFDDGTGVGDDIRGLMDSLLSKGVRIEACDISLDWMGVAAADLFGGIAVIDNAFAAAIFYQRRGFATVPVTSLP